MVGCGNMIGVGGEVRGVIEAVGGMEGAKVKGRE
jgi:hypothetical protein